ncbi:MAG TPA: histone deacetylase family protein [Allosphingosinicella sp.]|uniref:histone deacetylase family protein n=1 Tax=Allosphingosinicella sp. TaxID=2823234 RepID=UPI002EDB079E
MFKTFDPRQLAHAPVQEIHNGSWAEHAEKTRRAEIIVERLGDFHVAEDFGMEPLRRIHTDEYLGFLQSAHRDWIAAGRSGDAIGYAWPVVGRRNIRLDRIDARLGRYSYDASTPITAETWDAAYWSAQTALTALAPLLKGEERNAFGLCRPPGHHSGADYLGGYCYLNNAAIAAATAADAGCKVAILDIDYHHGNGTQDIFLDRGDIFFASIHADPATDYPFFWGHADETGIGAGKGATLNLPLPQGTRGPAYLDALKQALDAIPRWDADFLIVSYGADTFDEDPISKFALRRDDYPVIAREIAGLGLPCLIVMEGGYAVDALGENVAAFLSGFSS